MTSPDRSEMEAVVARLEECTSGPSWAPAVVARGDIRALLAERKEREEVLAQVGARAGWRFLDGSPVPDTHEVPVALGLIRQAAALSAPVKEPQDD